MPQRDDTLSHPSRGLFCPQLSLRAAHCSFAATLRQNPRFQWVYLINLDCLYNFMIGDNVIGDRLGFPHSGSSSRGQVPPPLLINGSTTAEDDNNNFSGLALASSNAIIPPNHATFCPSSMTNNAAHSENGSSSGVSSNGESERLLPTLLPATTIHHRPLTTISHSDDSNHSNHSTHSSLLPHACSEARYTHMHSIDISRHDFNLY